MKKYQIGGSMQSRTTSDELNPYKIKTPVAPNPGFVPSGTMNKMKMGGSLKKAQEGEETIKGNRPGIGVFKTKITRPDFDNSLLKPYEYTRESIDTTGYSKGKEKYNLKTVTGEGDAMRGGKDKTVSNKTIYKKDVPNTLKTLQMKKGGQMKKSKKC